MPNRQHAGGTWGAGPSARALALDLVESSGKDGGVEWISGMRYQGMLSLPEGTFRDRYKTSVGYEV